MVYIPFLPFMQVFHQSPHGQSMSEFKSKVFNDMLTNNHYGITKVETVTNNISVCLLTVLEFNLLKLQN